MAANPNPPGSLPNGQQKTPRRRGLMRCKSSGANRNRTGDIYHAKIALYQLSYSPKGCSRVPASRLSSINQENDWLKG